MNDTFFQDNKTGMVKKYSVWLKYFKKAIMNRMIADHRMIEVRKTDNGWEEA